MRKYILALMMIVVLLPAGWAESASAWHTDPDLPDADILPHPQAFPEEPPLETGIIPVDRTLRDKMREAGWVNETVQGTYQVASSIYSEAQGTVTETAAQPLTVYRDGTGGFMPGQADHPDARHGGFGEWRLHGTSAWDLHEEAAFSGESGFMTSSEPGRYPGHAHSLLVTPEIDLRTNFLMQASEQPTSNLSTVSTVYHGMYYGCDVATWSASVGVLLTGIWMYQPEMCEFYRMFNDHEHTYAALEYSYRHNLAEHPSDPDEVQVMVFTEPPQSIKDSEDCGLARTPPNDPIFWLAASGPFDGSEIINNQTVSFRPLDQPCQIVRPKSINNPFDFRFTEGMNHTGFQDWSRASVDLTQWENQSVWVGFLFRSGSIVNPDVFFDGPRFNTDVDFRGFQLDDLEVKIPAAAVNLAVKPLSEPSFRAHPREAWVTADPDRPVPVKTYVTNLATESRDVTVVTRILHGDPDEPDYWTLVGEEYEVTHDAQLGPVEHLEIDLEFDLKAFNGGFVVAHVCVYRNESGRFGGDMDYCTDQDNIPRRDDPTLRCSNDPLEADPCNQFQVQWIHLAPITLLSVGDIRRSTHRIDGGESMEMQMPITNSGNAPAEVVVHAEIRDTADGSCGGGACWGLAGVDPPLILRDAETTVVVDPLHTTNVRWTVESGEGAVRGSYVLFVKIGDVPGFSVEQDLLAAQLRPWEAFPVTANEQTGFPGLSAWASLERYPLGNGETAQVAYNESYVFLRLNRADSAFTLFLNDHDDDDIHSGGGGIGWRYDGEGNGLGLREENGWRLFPAHETVVGISAGESHTLAVMDDGSVYSWGVSDNNRLGRSTNDPPQAVPGQVTGGGIGNVFIVKVSAGGFPDGQGHSLAVTDDGFVYSWGSNNENQLGRDTAFASDGTPGEVENLAGVQSVAAGGTHSLAVSESGVVFSWGNEVGGRLGRATNLTEGSNRAHPVPMPSAEAVAAGVRHSLALGQDGHVYSWGRANEGQLGRPTGDGTPSNRPAPVPGLENVVAVAAGSDHSLALTSDGSVFAWGLNANGQLGLGDNTNRASPSRVTDLDGLKIVAVSAGDQHSMALVEEGQVFSWGRNNWGQLGLGHLRATNVPQQVVASREAGTWEGREISAGGSFSYALTTDNMPLAWGSMHQGRLGIGHQHMGRNPLPSLTMSEETVFSPWAGIQLRYLEGVDVRIPLNQEDGSLDQGLRIGPGEGLGIALRLCRDLAPGFRCNDHPQSVPLYDGDGFHPPDGTMANELRQWRTVHLTERENVVGFSHRSLSDPFGVRMSIPPYYSEDFQGGAECPSMSGWGQRFEVWNHDGQIHERRNPREEGPFMNQWQCGTYPDDGRALLYFGQWPCPAEDCSPYVTQNVQGVRRVAGVDWPLHQEYRVWTPPIEIPSDARSPTVVLAHQYSTHVHIDDAAIGSEDVKAHHLPRMHVERWDEANGRWVDLGLLRPMGGFPTPESIGIADSRFERSHPGQLHLGAAGDDLAAWWWPQGNQPDYRPPDRQLAVGGNFVGGSPWTTDRLPLYGSHFDGDPLAVAGATIRLRFDLRHGIEATPGSREDDWGWRIGGLAVIDENEDREARISRDLTIESVKPVVGFDPYKLGFGPGTTVQFDVVIRNDGGPHVFDSRRDHVRLFLDGEEEKNVECGQSLISGELDTDENLTVQVDCTFPSTPGIRISARAGLDLAASDDFMGNHQQRVPGVFDLRPAQRVDLQVQATPRVDAVGVERRFTITLENTGNVPLEGGSLVRTVSRVTNLGFGSPVAHQWTFSEGTALPIGGRISIAPNNVHSDGSAAAVDLWNPSRDGTYLAEFVVTVPGIMGVPVRDRVEVQLDAFEQLYREDFEGPPEFVPGVIVGELERQGTPDVWEIHPTNRGDSAMRAGDPVTGEIPANASALLRLPTVDLTSSKRASLSFEHRYDLESMFDAGRVEMSVDGGVTWHPVVPEPHPCMPEGYPSKRVIGLNALLDQSREVELFAGAFTGRMEDLIDGQACLIGGAVDEHGWVTTEIDLNRQPAFWVEEVIDAFPLREMTRLPDTQPLNVEIRDLVTLERRPDWRFTDPSWFLQEEGSFDLERYWWIQNVTYSEPRPVSGDTMWWSGTMGEVDPDERPNLSGTSNRIPRLEWTPHGIGLNQTAMEFHIDPEAWPGMSEVTLSFWDWRAGWQDTADPAWEDREREGTGGSYAVMVRGQEVLPSIVERRDDGWTKRMVTVDLETPAQINFIYTTGAHEWSDTAPPPTGLHYCYSSGVDCSSGVWLSFNQNNRGWFLDDLEVSSTETSDTISAGEIQVRTLDGEIAWSQVRVGETARDGGWHVDAVEVPGHGVMNVWRFSDDSAQGYPSNSDSRLVTPAVDLRAYSGTHVSLLFDHKYEFHGLSHMCRDSVREPDPLPWDPDSDCGRVNVGRAIDAGAVTYQVYDELTGTWGPWQPLHGMSEDPDIGFSIVELPGAGLTGNWAYDFSSPRPDPEGNTVRSMRITEFLRVSDSTNPDQLGLLTQTGYPAVMHYPARGLGQVYERGGLGAGFPTSDAWIRGDSWQQYSVAYVFTDESDWASVEWDVSRFIGSQVRFGFHAWTNPSGEPCGRLEYDFYRMGQLYQTGSGGGGSGTSVETPCDPDRPLDGWTVANVGLQGQRFRGDKVDIRFHIATDESNPKGEWSIGEVRLAGERYTNSVVFDIEEPHILDVPGSTAVFDGWIRNLGSESRSGLALVIDAVDTETGQSFPGVELIGSDLGKITDSAVLPSWVKAAYGDFSLTSVTMDAQSSALPVRLEVKLPQESPSNIRIDLQLLERVEACARISGQLVCSESYQPVFNERGSALPMTSWTAEGSLQLDYQVVPPREGRVDILVVDPMVVDVGEPTRLEAKVINVGTLEGPVDVMWTVQEIVSKGCPQDGIPCAQRGTQENLGTVVTIPQILQVDRGQSTLLYVDFTPENAGLHRAIMEIVEPGSGGKVLTRVVGEFIAGPVEPYYFIDFATTNATDPGIGWSTGSPEKGTTVSAIDFRQLGPQFVWGVTAEEFQAGIHYCSQQVGAQEGCNPPSQLYDRQNQARDNPVYGLEGIALSPLVDLTQVVGDRATMTLRHGHLFQDRDGAMVEAMLLETPPGRDPRPVFFCSDGSDRRAAWFRMSPDPGTRYAGLTRGYDEVQLQTNTRPSPSGTIWVTQWAPPRLNPLDLEPPRGAMSIGGPGVDSETLQFRLEDPALTPICPQGFGLQLDPDEDPPGSLINYTVQFRLRTGTTPLSVQHVQCENDWTGQSFPSQDNRGRCRDDSRTTGGLGWQIDGLGVTSIGASASPQERHLPLVDGYPKLFGFHLQNSGFIDESFRITLEGDPSDPAMDWVTLPETEVFLMPNERRIVPFHVDIPAGEDLERGPQTFIIRATSMIDPGIFDEVVVTLDLLDHHLPDLELRLEATGRDETVPTFEVGRLAEFVATISNRGQASSEEVPLIVEAVREEDGAEIRVPVFSGEVPRLCPLTDATCEAQGDGRINVPFMFNAPSVPGNYTIQAVLDPDGRLVQESTMNNRASMNIKVVPLQRPDLAVSDLHLGGVRDDGYALEGTTVRIVVDVENRGSVPATGALLNLMAGGAHIIENRALPTLVPGQTHQVFANLSGLSPGETRIWAFVFHELDLDTSNTEMIRMLRVRGLDLAFTGPPEPVPLSPGQTTTTRIHLQNEGNAVEQIRLSLGDGQGEWGFVATPNPVTVAPNSTAWSVITIQAPVDAGAGEYGLDVVATPLSQPTAWLDFALPVRVSTQLDAPDLNILPLETAPGPATLLVDLGSRSNAPQVLQVEVQGPGWVSTATEVTLGPGNNTTRAEVPLVIPPTTSPGDHPVLVAVYNETDAQLAGTAATVRVLPKAAATAHWEDRILSPETDLVTRVFQVPLNVTNTGNLPFVPEPVVTGLTEGARYLRAGSLDAVKPGDSMTIPITLQVNAEFTKRVQGEVDVLIHVNQTQIAGDPPGDPVSVARLSLPDIAALPDLEIADVFLQPRSGVPAGEEFRITVVVRNAGFVDAPKSDLYAFVDGEFVQAMPVGSLEPGEEYLVNLTWAFPRSGDRLVSLQADGPGAITELYEDNNGWTQVIRVESGGISQRIQEAPAPAPLLGILLLLLVALALANRRSRPPQTGGPL